MVLADVMVVMTGDCDRGCGDGKGDSGDEGGYGGVCDEKRDGTWDDGLWWH